jgi:hypothetical protein
MHRDGWTRPEGQLVFADDNAAMGHLWPAAAVYSPSQSKYRNVALFRRKRVIDN